MMKTVLKIAATAIIIATLGACATSSYGNKETDFQIAKAAQIKRGMSQEQVAALFDRKEPAYKHIVDGRETWTYSKGSINVGSGEAVAKMAIGTVATTAIGMLIPGAGVFASLGTTLAGFGPGASMGSYAQKSESVTVVFGRDRRVESCVASMQNFSTVAGSQSVSESNHCGDSA